MRNKVGNNEKAFIAAVDKFAVPECSDIFFVCIYGVDVIKHKADMHNGMSTVAYGLCFVLWCDTVSEIEMNRNEWMEIVNANDSW